MDPHIVKNLEDSRHALIAAIAAKESEAEMMRDTLHHVEVALGYRPNDGHKSQSVNKKERVESLLKSMLPYGVTNKEIANKLGISMKTANNYTWLLRQEGVAERRDGKTFWKG